MQKSLLSCGPRMTRPGGDILFVYRAVTLVFGGAVTLLFGGAVTLLFGGAVRLHIEYVLD